MANKTELDIVMREIREEIDSVTPIEYPIYHYTSPDGFLNILQKDSINLRFFRFDTMNDKEEGKDIINIYQRACRELFDDNIIDGKFYDNIIKFKPNPYFTITRKKEDECNDKYFLPVEMVAYICCFSKSSDSLPMWNYYIKGNSYQGYNFGLESNLMNYNDNEESIIQYNLVELLYEDEAKIDIIKSVIRRLYEKRNCDNDSENKIKRTLTISLRQWQLKFKNNSFKHEEEIRAILLYPVPESVSYNHGGCKNLKKELRQYPIQFANKNGYISPYVVWKYNKNLFNCVTVGPLLEKEASHILIKEFLKSRDYNTDNVYISNVPVRF